MHSRLTRIATLLALASCAGTAVATEATVQTGVTRIGPGMLLLAIAVGLLLTLLLKPIAGILVRRITEQVGNRRIEKLLHAHSTEVLSNVILPGVYGGLTRIDHLIMTAGGVICILAKHHGGSIVCSENEAQWTHVDGGRRRRFLNPRIQNEGRVNAVRRLVADLPVANLVIFTGAADFGSTCPKNVIRVRDLKPFLKNAQFEASPIQDWDAAWLTIKSAVLTDEDSRRDFAAQLSFG